MASRLERGEFGGELVFESGTGEVQRILEENVIGIFHLIDEVVAVTGLAHLTINDGLVYRLKRSREGVWSAEKWVSLPGAPESASIAEDGRFLVHSRGGSVFLSGDGELELMACESSRVRWRGPVQRRAPRYPSRHLSGASRKESTPLPRKGEPSRAILAPTR